MKTKVIIVTLLIGLITLTSCRSREEKVISDLASLSERIDSKGKNYDAEDWEKALEELSYIHQDIQDCEFTDEQLRELGKVEGQLSAIIMKEISKTVGQGFSSIIKSIGSFASGFIEGADGNIIEEDFEEDLEEISNEISNMLKAVELELSK